MQAQFESRAAARKPYPSDVSDDECALVAPRLALVREGAAERRLSRVATLFPSR